MLKNYNLREWAVVNNRQICISGKCVISDEGCVSDVPRTI